MSDKKIVLPETETEEDKGEEKPDKPLDSDISDIKESKPVSKPTHAGGNKATIILLVILLVIASLTLYFVWRNDKDAEATTAATTAESTTAAKVTANDTADTATSVTATTATAATKKSAAFETALNAKDYNAMKLLMADPMNFVLDATECCGDVTADKAITQLKGRIDDAGIDTYNFSPEQQIIKNMKVNQPQAFGKWNNIGISNGRDFFAYNLNANGKVSEAIMGFTDSYDLD